ncbi:MAG: PhoH family protein [Phycisphaeraceae bacterium]|nr:PhoH family protein [Phycisphaerales bacterium]MCB9860178.1 PhoH family protein [Phycisphaeraceae bacterium]
MAKARSPRSSVSKTTKGPKYFVIDTNVLLHNPESLFVFEENHVVIPFPVIEEIDSMKRREDDVGRNARHAIRFLDRLRTLGTITEGVSLSLLDPATLRGFQGSIRGEGTVRIDVNKYDRPEAIAADKADNLIIAVAWHLYQQGKPAVFVSKDLGARIKSDALGIPTEDFENEKVDADRMYTGYITVNTEDELIDELYADRLLELDRLSEHLATKASDGSKYTREVHPNEYVVLKDAADESHTGLSRRLADSPHIMPITSPRKPVSGILPRNVQQTMALDLLMDDDIRLVTLLGGAGTGKTLLALAAGMWKVFNEKSYDKLLVARPIMPMGRDIGYLPGDKDEKLGAWMQPIFDNLEYLLSTRGSPLQAAESHTAEQRIKKLMADGQLVLEPLTYIRGRSIPHQFMVVDEAQNLTPHEVKTIISRTGEGSKIVLTGDIEQIDNPYLDQSSNGLSYCVEKMKGARLFGHVTLLKSERSDLASLAIERL